MHILCSKRFAKRLTEINSPPFTKDFLLNRCFKGRVSSRFCRNSFGFVTPVYYPVGIYLHLFAMAQRNEQRMEHTCTRRNQFSLCLVHSVYCPVGIYLHLFVMAQRNEQRIGHTCTRRNKFSLCLVHSEIGSYHKTSSIKSSAKNATRHLLRTGKITKTKLDHLIG